MKPLAPFLLIAALASACAVGTRVTAGHDDYRLYRETRLASSVEERLAASSEYLQRMPEGKWRSEVRAWFRLAEPAYFRSAQDSLPRLRAYMAAMPTGPHAKEVASRIVELETEIGFAQRREGRALSSARRVQSDLSLAAEQRQRVVRGVSEWLRLLAKIESWGEPTAALDHELIYQFRLQPPVGSCASGACRKTLSLPYAIPEQGRLGQRVALFDIVLRLEQGGVTSAELSGPELFSRLGEALELRAVELARAQTRVEAIGRVLPLIANALEATLPEQRCARDPVSPTVLERSCDGRRVQVIAGAGGEDEDRIVFQPDPRGAEKGHDR